MSRRERRASTMGSVTERRLRQIPGTLIARAAVLIGLGLGLALPAVLLATPVQADLRPLTLYQRAGRSPWIVLGEIEDGDDRFARVKVIEILKGSYDGAKLRIVFRMENFLRKAWEEKIEFAAGERAVLFLKRYETDREDGKVPEDLSAPDVFACSFGAMGKFNLPEEGAPAYLDALREFVRVTAMQDIVAQEEALLGYLTSSNPHILQAGLEQVLEGRLAGTAQVPLLLALSDNLREAVRLNALKILVQVAEDLRAANRTLPDQPNVVNVLKGKVIGEGSDIYRAEALKGVAALAAADERAFLERISKEDRAQIVRYEASRILLSLERR